jgi:hypothetical protein
MATARALFRDHKYRECFTALERAHILGQRYYVPHIVSHWWMLKVAVRTADIREIAGQLLRIAASVGSLLGWVPVGNTGGSNVSPVKPLPLPSDLEEILRSEKKPSVTTLAARLMTIITVISLCMWIIIN